MESKYAASKATYFFVTAILWAIEDKNIESSFYAVPLTKSSNLYFTLHHFFSLNFFDTHLIFMIANIQIIGFRLSFKI